MRVVLDTNVLISALIAEGKPHELLKALLARGHALILSEPMVEEFSRVAADEKIRRYTGDEEFVTFMRILLSSAVFVRVRSKIRVFDDPDDLVLSTAKDGKADAIVTGDKHLLSLREFKGIKIVTVERMLVILRTKNS